jgi:hypothetical protein
MKRNFYLTTIIALTAIVTSSAQTLETTIRNLELTEAKAVLEKDTATLRKLWSENYTVNSPAGRVVVGGKNTLDRPVVTQSNFTSFIREVEHVLINENCVITMGGEIVVPALADNTPGPVVKRRYTNVWMKIENSWKLTARHANIICR